VFLSDCRTIIGSYAINEYEKRYEHNYVVCLHYQNESDCMCETSIKIFNSVKLYLYRLTGYNIASFLSGKPFTELHCILLINFNTRSNSLYLISATYIITKRLFPSIY